jgi:phytanoyl-CoA hydroxylase
MDGARVGPDNWGMTATTAQPLARLADEFQRNGVVKAPSVLDPAEVAAIRDAFMEEIARGVRLGWDDGVPEGDILARYPRFVQPHRQVETAVGRLARQYLLDERLLAIMTALLGPVLGAQSMFYFKPPTARGQALHQDNISLQAHPETCAAAWIAIDDADAENGGLIVVPGSHRLEIQCPDDADPSVSFTSGGLQPPDDLDRVQTELQAGDVLFFHGSLIHGSNPNRSAGFRRSLIFHYVPAASIEVASLYQPLLAPDGNEVYIDEAADGGPCGVGFRPEI